MKTRTFKVCIDEDICLHIEQKAKKDVKDKLEDELFDIDVTSSTDWKEFWKKHLGK